MARVSHLSTLRSAEAAEHAFELRRSLTRVERRLWYHLRAKRFQGFKIRRQVPLGPYVVDFLCERAKLIIEADGGQHAERLEQDAKRTRWIEAQGYRVIRYWNNEVMRNLEGVLLTILDALKAGEKSDPLPGPPPRGREMSNIRQANADKRR